MTDKMQIAGPVTIRDNSRERVAYDLMMLIANGEQEKSKTRDRAYWLELYHDCYRVTDGNAPL